MLKMLGVAAMALMLGACSGTRADRVIGGALLGGAGGALAGGVITGTIPGAVIGGAVGAAAGAGAGLLLTPQVGY